LLGAFFVGDKPLLLRRDNLVKTLSKYIKEFTKDSILTPVFMIIEVICEMIMPLLMASIIDEGVENGNLNHIYKTGGLMVVCAVIGLLSGLLGAKLAARASAGFARNLRKGMFDNIQRFSFANIDKFSTAGLVTRMTTDVTSVQQSYQMLLRMCMRAPATLVIALFMAYNINKRITNIYFVAVIFLSICLFFIIRAGMKYFRQMFKMYDGLNESVQENVTGIRVVKAFVREEHEIGKFNKANKKLYDMSVKAESIVVTNMPLMMFTVYVCILLISWVGAHMIVSNELTTGELMSLLTYCMSILTSLMMVSMIFVMMSMSIAAMERIAEVLTEEPTIVNPENPVFEVQDGSIEYRDVYFRYNMTSKEPVLKDIDLKIESGEVIGIIGGTGSAKTSLVNLISRLYDVTGGEVLVGNRNVKEYDLETLRNEVSVVLQKNVLFSGSILDNLRWGNKDATLEECREACKIACADDFIMEFENGYDTKIEQGGTNVSGGQKQRLCIARALLKKPKILILDDSTSAVDTATDAKITEGLKNAIPETTKIIIAQRISSVMHADRIVVMDNGKINGVGTHEELLNNNEIYRDVYESQTVGAGDFDEKGGAN
jgi:ATP-binding cassette, subfamily B, multidrug efflux pump